MHVTLIMCIIVQLTARGISIIVIGNIVPILCCVLGFWKADMLRWIARFRNDILVTCTKDCRYSTTEVYM